MPYAVSYAVSTGVRRTFELQSVRAAAPDATGQIQNWRGRDGNDPSVDIGKDAD